MTYRYTRGKFPGCILENTLADIQPFRGSRYSLSAGTDLGELLCPPYDIISPELQSVLHQRNPYNAIRLEFGLDLYTDSSNDNRYTRAAGLLREWLDQKVLLTEDTPAIYLLQENFMYGGRLMTRRSILAVVRLEEFSKGVIIPHEETSQGPKRDRMELLAATKANLSPIMAIYRDQNKQIGSLIDRVSSEPPIASVDYDEMNIQLWVITDNMEIRTVTDSFVDVPVYLADGHHRYETALQYRDIQNAGQYGADGDGLGKRAHNFVMMSLIEIHDPGLVVLPYHRVIGGLSNAELGRLLALIDDTFELQTLDVMLDRSGDAIIHLQKVLDSSVVDQVAIGLLEGREGKVSVLTLRNPTDASSPPLERSATHILGRNIIQPVLGTQQSAVERGILRYTHDSREVSHLLSNGDCQLGFILPNLSLELFEEVVLSGQRMPIKSTYFSPKLPTGLVINRLV